MTKFIKVSEFAQKFVPNKDQQKFYQLMKEWDGSSDVGGAFYTIDVLEIKRKEAAE